jgi:magnesium transporter
LTVISAVFLPLTLLAGIWGMNFMLMPELQLSFGYPLGLGLMALIAGGLTWLFYMRGWFD